MSVCGSFIDISQVIRVVSFSLIALLGLILLAKNVRDLFFQTRRNPAFPEGNQAAMKKKGMLPFALVVGAVPWPGVVTEMLF